MDNEGLLKWAEHEVERTKEMLNLVENHMEMLRDTIEKEAQDQRQAAKEEQLQKAMELIRERLSLHIRNWDNSYLERGRAEGMEEALVILMDVVQ